jgi:O-antigen/teichoic acid export membrane protein
MPLTPKGAWQERRIFWTYCLPLSMSGGIAVPANWLSYTYATDVVGFAALGGYMGADRFRGMLMFIPMTVRQVSLPMLSELRALGHRRRFIRALWANVGVNLAVTAVGAVPIMLLSPWLMSWFGPEFRSEWSILIILASTAVVQSAANVVAQVTAAAGRTWLNFIFSALFSAVMLTVALTSIPRLGARGLAWATFAGQSTLFCCHAALTYWQLKSGALFSGSDVHRRLSSSDSVSPDTPVDESSQPAPL